MKRNSPTASSPNFDKSENQEIVERNRIVTEWFNKYYTLLNLKLRTHTKDKFLLEESLAETFFKVSQLQSSYLKKINNVPGFLWRVAVNSFLTIIRRQQIVPVDFQEDYRSDILDEFNQVLRVEEEMDFLRMLSLLDEQNRKIMWLAFLGYRQKEIAAILKIPQGTIGSAIKRSKEFLSLLLIKDQK